MNTTTFTTKDDLLEAVEEGLGREGSRELAERIVHYLCEDELIRYDNVAGGFVGWDELDDSLWEEYVKLALVAIEEHETRLATEVVDGLKNHDLACRLNYLATHPGRMDPVLAKAVILEAAARLGRWKVKR